MKRGGLATLFLMLAPAQFANAVTFDVTQLTMQVGPFNGTQGGALAFTLIGPGTNISGFGNFVCQQTWCMFPPSNTVSPGTLLTTVGQIGLDDAFRRRSTERL